MRKFLWIVGAVIVLTIAAGSLALRRDAEDDRGDVALGLAKEFIGRSDMQGAMMWLRKALEENPRNEEACRLMADLAELARSPSAVLWRRKVIELAPGSVPDLVALARAAIASEDLDTAQDALARVPESARDNPEYLRMAGALAAARGEFEAASDHFREAIGAEPESRLLRLNLAVARLRAASPGARAEGRAILEELRNDPEARTEALRHLVLDALRVAETDRAIQTGEELAREPGALFTDRLLLLEAFRAGDEPRMAGALAELQESAADHPARVFDLGKWMLAALPPGEALEWFHRLEPVLRTNLPVAIVVADALMGSGDWQALREFVADQAWGGIEPVRLAYLARALREQGMNEAARSEWTRALTTGQGDRAHLWTLHRVASGWGWHAEAEEVLWLIVGRYPGDADAVRLLTARLHSEGRTRALLSLYQSRRLHAPQDLELKNNVAALALLLGAIEHQPHALALEAYRDAPEDPNIASTYAYSLLVQGRAREALDVFRTLSASMLELPAVSGYYGLVLAACGDAEGARQHCERALQGRLLPEEVALFHAVRRPSEG